MALPPDRLSQTLRRCEGYGELGMWHQAWEELEDLPDQERTRLPALIWRVRTLAGMGFHRNAVSLGGSLVRTFPASVGVKGVMCEALIALARSETQTGDPQVARECLAQCLEIDPDRRQGILSMPEFRHFASALPGA